MPKIAYFDCFSGISGDMILGALIHVGVDPKDLQTQILRAGAPPFELDVHSVRKGKLWGTQVTVIPHTKDPTVRTLAQMESRINRGKLSRPLREKVRAIFNRLARAEARVHRVPIKKVHFHEMGATDTMVDIIGAVIGFSLLGIDQIFSSPVNVGGGEVVTSEGVFPVPSPATAELLKGIPIRSDGTEAELATPTGAAILASLSKGFSPIPSMTLKSVGYGAGSQDLSHPNLLRLMVGEREKGLEEEPLHVLETQIDDMNPQFYDHIMERLHLAGALDVFLTPVIMKKGRPGILVTVLGEEDKLQKLTKTLLTETTTLGVRRYPVQRQELSRVIQTVKTPYGPVRVKVSSFKGKAVQRTPEYEDLRILSKKAGLPLKQVWLSALHAIQLADLDHDSWP